MMDPTRAEHMRWCKRRALEYLDQPDGPDVPNAIASMLSDLSKHRETAAAGRAMGPIGLSYAMAHDTEGARRFIEGFAE